MGCATLTAAGCGSSAPDADGPLVTTKGVGTGAAPQAIGRAFSWGATLLFTDPGAAPEPIVIDRVTLDGVRPATGLELVGVKFARDYERRSGAFFVVGDWPPTRSAQGPIGPVADATGFAIVPGPLNEFERPGGYGVDVLVGLRLAKRGRYSVGGLSVDYHQGSRRYRERLPSAFEVASS